MNEEQYKVLCETCDRILTAPDATLECIAIPWLHVIREHPVMLSNYSALFANNSAGKNSCRKRSHRLRDLFRWSRHFIGVFLRKGRFWYGPEIIPGKIDFLFVSHFLNPSMAGKDDDFYFGCLPYELSIKGYSSAVVLINHSGRSAGRYAGKWRANPVPRYLLSRHLSPVKEWKLRNRLKKESKYLRMRSDNEADGLFKKILFRASEEALSFNALFTLRMHSQMLELVSKLRPKAVITTLEGHAWERCVFSASRKAHPDVFCIGYQHAALFRLQHAIKRPLAPEYNPDRILTAGTVSETQLKNTQSLNTIPISVLGSGRIYRPKSAGFEKQNSSTCLVIPEGIESECDILFDFSIKCAQTYPDVQFVWRLHPVVTWESLLKRNPGLRHLPINIILSKSTLDDDLGRCDCALYRGSTAIVQAVIAGLRPIYLELDGELTIDPLYELGKWRVIIRNSLDFKNVFYNIAGSDTHEMDSEKISATIYCADFFTSFDIIFFENLLHKI